MLQFQLVVEGEEEGEELVLQLEVHCETNICFTTSESEALHNGRIVVKTSVLVQCSVCSHMYHMNEFTSLLGHH